MIRLFLHLLVLLALVGTFVFFVLTMPHLIESSELPEHKADLKNGEYIFYAGGCASCHAAPATSKCDDVKSKESLKLAGGRCLKTPFGKFYVPNISPDKQDGIGGWSNVEFVNAMMRGVSPDGEHYYPALPYTSYQRMKYVDLIDLKAFLDTLPAVKSKVPDHDLSLLFSYRRALGLWKLLFMDRKQFKVDPGKSDELNRGAYLVQGPGHCGECHSPRNLLGGIIKGREYSGGPAPEGEGFISNITPHKTGLGDWSVKDIAYMLETGFTPEYDVVGGSMAKVQENMAKLTSSDRNAIAVYLKSLPAVQSQKRKRKKE